MKKTYVLAGVDTAIALLRPGAKYCIYNTEFLEWNDPRPFPTWDEISDIVEKIKKFEDTIESIELEEEEESIS